MSVISRAMSKIKETETNTNEFKELILSKLREFKPTESLNLLGEDKLRELEADCK